MVLYIMYYYQSSANIYNLFGIDYNDYNIFNLWEYLMLSHVEYLLS